MHARKWRFFEALVKRRGSVRLHAKSKRRKGPLTHAFVLGTAACITWGSRAYGEEAVVPPPPAIASSPDVAAPPPPTPPAATLSEVVVTGAQGSYRSEDVVMPKYTQPILDTPQSITVVPEKVVADQADTTLRDVLRNVPGISLAAGEGSSQGDNLTIRGFTARSDIYLDGMHDFGSYYRDPFDMQQVDVLQGPASSLFGMGSTGGVVNQVSKSPMLNRFNAESLVFGTDRTKRATADINEPLTELSDTAAFRLNMMSHYSETADRDVAQNQRLGFAPSLEFGIGTPTRVTLEYFHQAENDIPDYGIPWMRNVPAPVSRHNYYGFVDGNYLKANVDVETTKVEHDFNDQVSLRDQARYATYRRSVNITEPQISAAQALLPLNQIQVTRNQLAVDSVETMLNNQLDLTTKFETAGIGHTLVTGMEVYEETSDPQRPTTTNVPTTSLLNPNSNQPYTATPTLTSRVHTLAHSLSLYLIDAIKLTPQWELDGSVRWDRFSAQYTQSIPPTAYFSRVDEMPSYRGSLVYKPLPNGSLYVSYGTSFDPSAEQLSLAANSANLEPETTKTYEAGSKWDLFDKAISVSGALFREEMDNARTTDPNNPLLNVLAGDERVQGFQLQASGYVTEKWEIFSGYAFMDSKIISSTTPGQTGNPLANAPKDTFSLWTTYDLPKNIEIGGGANAVSSRNGNTTPVAANGLMEQVPGYMTFDAMLKVPVTGKINVQLNLYNILDQNYIDAVHPGHIIPGAGRTLLVSTNFSF